MKREDAIHRMESNKAVHQIMIDVHDELISEHDRLWLVRLGLSFLSIRHHQIIGACRAFKMFDRRVVAENTRIFEIANGRKWVA